MSQVGETTEIQVCTASFPFSKQNEPKKELEKARSTHAISEENETAHQNHYGQHSNTNAK